MIAGLKAKVANLRGNSGNSLHADLKRITDARLTEIPQELIEAVVEASHDANSRQEMMRHLRECLAEQSSKHWHRVYAALILVENLLLRPNSQVILAETAEGYHFDVVQRLAFLEHFELNTDRRAQHMLRSKAKEVRTKLIPKLEAASEEGLLKSMEEKAASQENASTCSLSSSLTVNSVNTSDSDEEPWHGVELPAEPVPGSKLVIDGIVSVGHDDDTTDESSGDEAHVQHQGMRKGSHRYTKKRSQQKVNVAPIVASNTVPSCTVDLLGL